MQSQFFFTMRQGCGGEIVGADRERMSRLQYLRLRCRLWPALISCNQCADACRWCRGGRNWNCLACDRHAGVPSVDVTGASNGRGLTRVVRPYRSSLDYWNKVVTPCVGDGEELFREPHLLFGESICCGWTGRHQNLTLKCSMQRC